jgi:hypothetical protein
MHDALSKEDILEWQKAMQNELTSLTKTSPTHGS